MSVNPYGRQWFAPAVSSAFSATLIKGDHLAMIGQPLEAIKRYQRIASSNACARRRLKLAKSQHAKSLRMIDSRCDKTIAVGFIDWFPNPEATYQHILAIFKYSDIEYNVVEPEAADLLVAGCYGDELIRNPSISEDKLVLFFCGENLGPSYDLHDFSLTTRSRSYCGKNIRHPQWISEFDLELQTTTLNNSYTKMLPLDQPRKLFVSAIYNNSTPEREEMLAALRQYFGEQHVHVFGSSRSGPVDKFSILSNSVINLCFENSIGEGYITEKLLHSKIFKCKSLYWGHHSYKDDFTSDDVYNLHERPSLSDALAWCKSHYPLLGSSFANVEFDIQSTLSGDLALRTIKTSLRRWMKLILVGVNLS